MEYLVDFLTKCLIKNKVVEPHRKEECIYGIEMVLGKILNYSTIILLAIVNGKIIPTIFFLGTFFSLRGRNGGYHAKSFFQCYIGTTIIYLFISQYVAKIVIGKLWIYIFMLFFSWIIIIAFAPVNHPNLNLSEKEVVKWKKSSRQTLLVITVILSLCSMLEGTKECVTFGVLGVFVDAILLYVAKLKGQEVKV